MIVVLAFSIGIVAGLRALTAPAYVSWAARLGWLSLGGTGLAFLGYRWTPWILTLAAVAEIVNDKLPATPSRKTPPQFITRIVTGGLSGTAIGLASGGAVLGGVAGVAGAVVGTLGGAALRSRLVRAIGGQDLPIAVLEDAIALACGFLIVNQTS